MIVKLVDTYALIAFAVSRSSSRFEGWI